MVDVCLCLVILKEVFRGASNFCCRTFQVVALRKEVRVLQVELMQARLTGMGNLGLARAGLSGESGSIEGGRGGPSETAARAAIQEAADLRRYWLIY